MDEHRAAPTLAVGVDMVVVVEALEAERAQLGRASPDTDTELDRCFEGGTGERFEHGQAGRVEQLGDHHIGQGLADLVVASHGGRPFRGSDHGVVGKASKFPAGLGEAHLPAVAQELGDRVDGAVSGTGRHVPGLVEVPESGEERLDVTMAQRGGIGAAVGSPREVLGPQSHRTDRCPDRSCGHADQRFGGPRLGRGLQPRLGDRPGRAAAVAVTDPAANKGQSTLGAPRAGPTRRLAARCRDKHEPGEPDRR